MTDDVAAYLDHLRVARRLAEHTLESYGRDLAILERFAAGLEKYIPGNPTVILQERPGAGGVAAEHATDRAGGRDGVTAVRRLRRAVGT